MPIEIAGHPVGEGHPCFIIAEAGVNHNGDPGLALKLVEAAAQAHVDAIKFQTFRADQLATPSAPKADYQIKASACAESQLEMLQRLELLPATHRELIAASHRCQLIFLSTPFDETSGNDLNQLGTPAFKVSSGDITHLPLLEHLAAFGKPILLSTGMSTLDEIRVAVDAITTAGNERIVLLHCVSTYPTTPADCNLRAMRTMADAFGFPVGFSDHTLGIEVALAAVALGAAVIEKHFTLDRALPGPDHQASLLPSELGELVKCVRHVETSLGDGLKVPRPSELATAAVARRSLVAAQTISAGTILREHMVAIRRPGSGLAPAQKSLVVGRMARENIPAGTLLDWDQLK